MKKEWPLWELFIRGQHGLNHRHVGSLHAPDAEMTIKNAHDVYTRRKEGVSIWVVPSAQIPVPRPPCSNRRWTRFTGTRVSTTFQMKSVRCDGDRSQNMRFDRKRYYF